MVETKEEKTQRALTLFEESVLKPDPRLRGCAHNQECYHELMEIREEVVEIVRKMNNPHVNLKPGDKNNLPAVKAINGISVILLSGALGKHYMKDWTEEQLKEWEEYVSTNA